MRPDLRPDPTGLPQRAVPSHSPPAAGDGLPPACHAARRLLRRAKAGEALAAIDGVFLPSGRWAGPDTGYPPCDRERTLHEASLLRAWCLIELKRHAEAETWLATARRLGHVAADAADLAVVEMNLALFRGEYENVRERAMGLLRSVTGAADRTHAELRLLLGAALRWQGNLNEAMGHVEFACSAFTVLDEPVRTAVAANFLGWTCLSLGRLDDSRRWFERALALNGEMDAPLRAAQNYQNLAIVCYKQGDYDPAAELLGKELALVRGLPDMTCRAQLALGQVRRLRGEHDAARAVLLEAYSAARQHEMAREEALALEFLGDVLRDERRPAEAREFYRRGMTVARRIAPRGDLVMELLRREGECLDSEGRHAEANRVLNEAQTLAAMVDDRFEAAVILRCLGVNAAHLGRWSQARTHLESACEQLRQLTARHEAMIAGFHLAQLLSRLSKTADGERSRRKAVDAAWRQALRAQQLSQELGVPHLADEIGGLVAGLARRRLETDATQPLWQVFSARRAPASRVVAVSSAMQHVLRRCDGYARYDTPVLLYGEAGTGRALLARRIHEHGPRGARPFLRLNCQDGDADALGRQLFGGAAGDDGSAVERGLVASAAGGTLLLDGIDELPRPLQGRILRLVQEGVYQQDGREHQVDVRLMAATEADLAALVESGDFRTDLYFRLRLMTVTVPPLRERPEDVTPLLDHFLTRLEGSTLAARTVFDPASLGILGSYAWPGNTDEVEAVAQQAWFLRSQARAPEIRQRITPLGPVIEFVADVDDGEDDGHASGMTWDTLTSLIERSGGNKARTARNLGVSRVTLYRWLKQLDPKAS